MHIVPYLHFGGNAEAALTRYAEIFGGQVEMIMRWSEAPPDMAAPADFQDKVMHASVDLGGARLMASDQPPDHFVPPQGVSISIDLPDLGRARAAFDALADGGQVLMAFAPTFWSKGFGMVIDRFGAQWMISADAAEAS